MSRKILKTISSELVEFIPSTHASDQELSKTAKDISKRPLIFKVRKLTREDKINISFEGKRDIRDVDGQDQIVVVNAGTILKYLWENCVIEVHNVLFEDKEIEVARGEEKNALFDTTGMDLEITECLQFVQKLSTFSDDEAKN